MNECFITAKDHKKDFSKKIQCRLINPSKTHIARISKNILDGINNEIRKNSNLIQWRNTYEVLNWFKSIDNKAKKTFIKFDIDSFYPSISKKTLLMALEFGRKFMTINQDDIDIVIHSCKTVLSYNGSTWIKKNNTDQFDIPMGSLHGAEACELVGLFLLDQLKEVLGKGDYGLYRDDGLVVFENSSCKIEKVSKAIRKIFNNNGFKITIETGSRKVEFLDVILDLNENSYRPFRKQNSETVYVHRLSNHPRYIKHQIPISINKRLNNLSKSIKEFDLVRKNYQDALYQSKYEFKLSYQDDVQGSAKTKRKRRRKVIYFQPPFSLSVITPIGRKFLGLVKKHFTAKHPLYKFLNPKCIKLSYCCLSNVKNEITSFNKKVRENSDDNSNEPILCNCRGRVKDPNVCPLNGECKKKQLVYRADVESADSKMVYIGSTGNSFKERYATHKRSLSKRESGAPTTLSAYYWQEKDKGFDPKITWSIVKEVHGKFNRKNGCPLCNRERLEISRIDKNKILNKRNELKSNCPHHRNNFFPNK